MENKVEKKAQHKVTLETIVKGKLCHGYCIECFYYNTNRRSYDEAYCEKNLNYHKPDDYCSQFSYK